MFWNRIKPNDYVHHLLFSTDINWKHYTLILMNFTYRNANVQIRPIHLKIQNSDIMERITHAGTRVVEITQYAEV